MTRTLLIPSLILLLLAAGMFALTATKPPGPSTIVFASADEIKTLDPGEMSWAGDIRAAMGLWEGLAAYDPATLAPVPGAAESWDISQNGLTYTFHLRPDACWSNGDPVTATDFLFAWKRVLTPVTAADYVQMLFHIRGAEEYYNAQGEGVEGSRGQGVERTADRKAAAEKGLGLAAPDPHTLVVTLHHPCTYFLDLVAFPPFYPLHEKAMAPFLLDQSSPPDLAKGYNPRWTRPPHLVTNGPYRLAEWNFKRYLLLVPNEYYWDRAAVKTKQLRLVAYDDPRAALLAYQGRTVDALSFVPQQFGPDLLDQQAKGLRHDIHFRPVFGTYYYIFNCKDGPFKDARLRKALALAVDKKQICDAVLRMGQRPVDTLVPPDSIPGYTSPAGLPRDVPAAQQLLAAAGFPNGRGLPEIEILYNNEAIHDRIAQAVGQMWQQSLGLHVRFRGVERSTFGSERRSHTFTLARGGWYGDYTDPTTWLDLARTGNGNNDGLYSNPAFDDLLSKADAEPDPQKRFALLRQAEAILVEQDFPFLPLYQYSDGYVFDEQKLAGLDLNVRLLTQFKYLHRR